MRRLPVGWAAMLLLAACAQQPVATAAGPAAAAPVPQAAVESSGSTGGGAGGITSMTVRGEVVVAHPPGRQDAIEEVQRVAAQHCPGGYLLRSLQTQAPEADRLTEHFLDYQAVIDCGGPLSSYGGSK